MKNQRQWFGKIWWKCIAVFTGCLLLAGCGEAAAEELLADLPLEQQETAESVQSGRDAEVADSTIFVHVCGAVEKPDVYQLPDGSRFYEAVEAAGGFRRDACVNYLNLATVLTDGSRLEIPTYTMVREAAGEGYVIAPDGSKTAGDVADDGLININTADVSALCSIPGIGESRARSIIAYRQEHGDFKAKEDIMQVTGVKEGMYAKIEEYITVD